MLWKARGRFWNKQRGREGGRGVEVGPDAAAGRLHRSVARWVTTRHIGPTYRWVEKKRGREVVGCRILLGWAAMGRVGSLVTLNKRESGPSRVIRIVRFYFFLLFSLG